ncbi:hypothetical protein, conserved, partial [Eimeria acervulina]
DTGDTQKIRDITMDTGDTQKIRDITMDQEDMDKKGFGKRYAFLFSSKQPEPPSPPRSRANQGGQLRRSNLKNIGSSIEQHLVDLVSGFGENPDAGFGERKFDLVTDINGHVPGHLGVLITMERGDSSGRLD